MNDKIRIATTRPHCPNCEYGYMFLMTIEHEVTPEVEPDVALMYQCRQCGHEIELYMSHMVEEQRRYTYVEWNGLIHGPRPKPHDDEIPF